MKLLKGLPKKNEIAGGTKKKKKRKDTAQNSIPYEELYEDGICNLGDGRWSVTYQFTDVNYKNIRLESQKVKFSQYCDFLNSLNESFFIQIHIYNKPLRRTNLDLEIQTPPTAGQELRECIGEYNGIIRDRIQRSDGYIQEKYLTVSITEESYEAAQKRFDQINLDSVNLLRDLESETHQLNKAERLTLLREIYRPEDASPISPNQNGLFDESDKDQIASYEMDFGIPEGMIRLGEQYVKPFFITEIPDEISDRILNDLTALNQTVFLTVNIHPQEVAGTIKAMSKRLRELDREAADSKSRQRKAGDPVPDIPRDLKMALDNAEDIYAALQSRNEKMFIGNILILLRGDSPEDLNAAKNKVRSRVLKAGCAIRELRFARELLFNSILPLGIDNASEFIKRGYLTTEISGFLPFSVADLVSPGGQCYGINILSRNLLVLDRRNFTNPHGLYLGASGSGKSMGAKLEIWEAFWRTDNTIIIVDLEGEFTKLVELLGGQVIHIRPDGKDTINPMDVNMHYSGENNESPIAMKTDFMMSLIETAGAYREDDAAFAKSIISRVCKIVYNQYLQDPKDENIPTLIDFYEEMKRQPEKEAAHMTVALELYVTGSMNLFAGKTNVDLHNRLLCFNVQHLGEQMRVLGMTIIQDFIWNLLTKNRDADKETLLYNDEIHYSLRRESTAEWLCKSWKRGRKYGLIATGMTQEVGDITLTSQSKALISNSEFLMLYRQKEKEIPALLEVIDLSDEQVHHLNRCEPGKGLLRAGNTILEFDNHIPKNTKLYKLISTKVGESYGTTG